MLFKGRLLSLALLSALAGQEAMAQEVSLELPPGSEGLRPLLESTSLTMSLGDVAPGEPQDYIAAARSDYRRILTGLYAQGHYGGTISILVDGREAESIASLDAPASILQIRIVVDPGPEFTFYRTELQPIAPDTELPEAFVPGEIARSDVIGDAVSASISAWRDVGFAKADVASQSITARHADNLLDVAIAIDPGPQLTFGNLLVAGNQAVRTERIVAITGLPDGKLFSPEELDLAAGRLRRTGAFTAVAMIESDEIGPGNTIDITAQVSEHLPRRIGFGAEISSLDGLSVNAFWLHRNLLGGAERLRFDAEITGIEGSTGGPDGLLSATFARPGTIHPDVDVQLYTAIERQDEPNYFLESAVIEASFIRYIRNDLTYEGGIGFLTARERTDRRTRYYTLFTMPLAAMLDQRDDRLNPMSGYFADLELTPFLGIVGGDDGARFYSDTRYYFSIGNRVTLAARGQIGSVIKADLLEAPADFLFYSGGTETVRGQPYNTLGVFSDTYDDDGNPITIETGGASFVGAQLEARIGITDSIGIVGFYDAGFVGPDALPSEDGEFHAGAGIGLRYNTPIGPIRFDLATPASGDNAAQSLEFYLGIGQAF